VLPRKNRLTRSSDFQRVRSQGRSWSDRLLVLLCAPNSLEVTRFGFSVSRRIGGAVVRNRIRRLMREAVRLQHDLIAPGWDVVFIARRGISGADYWAVEESVTRLLRLARLYRSPERTSPGTEGDV
jgi:ribonuclease P protein component